LPNLQLNAAMIAATATAAEFDVARIELMIAALLRCCGSLPASACMQCWILIQEIAAVALMIFHLGGVGSARQIQRLDITDPMIGLIMIGL
jgi:hypothetical protein